MVATGGGCWVVALLARVKWAEALVVAILGQASIGPRDLQLPLPTFHDHD